jgi:hypothetical protein
MSGTAPTASDGQGIFISYRRSDCLSQANGLHDGLVNRLPGARIFMDVDSIPAGVDFEQHIREAIDGCDVVLVLIGDNWMDTRPGTETRRIDEPNDFVRLEIESALANARVTVIPVLVEGAQMPEVASLPDSIQRLARINAFELDDRRWKADLARITELLEGLKSKPAGAQPTQSQSPTPQVQQPQEQVYRPPPSPPYGAQAAPVFTPPPAQQPAYGVPQVGPASWTGQPPIAAPMAKAPSGAAVGVVCALLPALCCGMLNFVPLLRSGLIRPAQRWQLIGTGVALEAFAIVGFVLVGTAPTNAEDTPVGAAANTGIALILLSVAVAVVLGFMFRNPSQDGR